VNQPSEPAPAHHGSANKPENGRDLRLGSTRASLELLYHISRELAAALDLTTLLQRVLSLSIQNVGAINGSIIVLDEKGQPVESAIVVGEKLDMNATSRLAVTFEQGFAGWVARNRQAALAPDTSRDERWLRRPDDGEDQSGPKSAISAPILAREQLMGVLTLVHPTPGFFDEEHLALVQAIADQAGAAVLNARLYAESRRQAEVMTGIAESAAAIAASLDVEEILQRILRQTSKALRTEVVSLALIDPAANELVYRASTASQEQPIVGRRQSMDTGAAGWVAREGRGVISSDPRQEARFALPQGEDPQMPSGAVACAPIRLKGQVIGILEASNPVDGAFGPDALLVLSGIGSMAGSAIRHGQLYEELRAAHRHYRQLFEDNIDLILLTDTKGIILEANRPAERLLGRPAAALRGLPVENLNVVNHSKLGIAFGHVSCGETISYEANLQAAPDEAAVPVQVYARETWIGEIPHIQWILQDISARKNLDTLREDLSAMIYHDLRSPLANIVSSLDVIASLVPPEDELDLKPLVSIAMRSTDRILRLTNSLLDISHLEAGQEVAQRRPCLIDQLIQDALEAVAYSAQNKEIELIAVVQQDLPPVLVDGDMIKRVLINLLENAMKFTPARGKITVGALLDGEAVLCWVRDTGPGIPKSEHNRVFEKFTRLQTKEGARGLGLGLAYCRIAVSGHGGAIWVESEPGCGAQFNFTLPAAFQELLPEGSA
jgi:two-component system, NtrC family, sensor histidine kinase KinB